MMLICIRDKNNKNNLQKEQGKIGTIINKNIQNLPWQIEFE